MNKIIISAMVAGLFVSSSAFAVDEGTTTGPAKIMLSSKLPTNLHPYIGLDFNIQNYIANNQAGTSSLMKNSNSKTEYTIYLDHIRVWLGADGKTDVGGITYGVRGRLNAAKGNGFAQVPKRSDIYINRLKVYVGQDDIGTLAFGTEYNAQALLGFDNYQLAGDDNFQWGTTRGGRVYYRDASEYADNAGNISYTTPQWVKGLTVSVSRNDKIKGLTLTGQLMDISMLKQVDQDMSKFSTADVNETYSLAGEYKNTFGDFGIDTVVGFTTATIGTQTKVIDSSTTTANYNNMEIYEVDIRGTYRGFTLGASYFNNGKSGNLKKLAIKDHGTYTFDGNAGSGFTVALAYTMDKVTLGLFAGQESATPLYSTTKEKVGDKEYTPQKYDANTSLNYGVGVSYEIAPHVTTYGSANFVTTSLGTTSLTDTVTGAELVKLDKTTMDQVYLLGMNVQF